VDTFINNISDWFATHPNGLLTGVPFWHGAVIVLAIWAVWGILEGLAKRPAGEPRLRYSSKQAFWSWHGFGWFCLAFSAWALGMLWAVYH
jgi:hypothetical protein